MGEKMKAFKDLEFKRHPLGNGKQARMDFPNGYGVSVVRFSVLGGYGSYTDNESEWELAVFKDGGLCYATPITDDVIGHLSADDVTKIMKKVQKLKQEKKDV